MSLIRKAIFSSTHWQLHLQWRNSPLLSCSRFKANSISWGPPPSERSGYSHTVLWQAVCCCSLLSFHFGKFEAVQFQVGQLDGGRFAAKGFIFEKLIFVFLFFLQSVGWLYINYRSDNRLFSLRVICRGTAAARSRAQNEEFEVHRCVLSFSVDSRKVNEISWVLRLI